MSANVYDIVTERIVASLDKGTVPWRKPWNAQTLVARSLASGKPYRGMNHWLLDPGLHGYNDPRYATYNQIQKLGGNVRKGEKGHICTLWRFVEDRLHPNKKRPLLRYFTVFNVQQSEGLDIAPWNSDQPKHEHSPIAACEVVWESWKNKPALTIGGAECFYRPSTDTINMVDRSAFCDVTDWYATLFHESVHATGHDSRLKRELKGAYSKESYSKEELIAEMGAAMLAAHTGINTPKLEENNVAYIKNWRDAIKGDNRLVVSAAGAAQRAVDSILGIDYNATKETEETE
jgi:antirestriction protein ArdC